MALAAIILLFYWGMGGRPRARWAKTKEEDAHIDPWVSVIIPTGQDFWCKQSNPIVPRMVWID